MFGAHCVEITSALLDLEKATSAYWNVWHRSHRPTTLDASRYTMLDHRDSFRSSTPVSAEIVSSRTSTGAGFAMNSIDQAVTESVAHYTKTINDARNLFLAVLGHDLRNPISAATVGAKMILRPDVDDARRTKVATEILRTTVRPARILDGLLDLSRSSFGTDLRLTRADMDMGSLCSELADELRALNGRIEVKLTGNTNGRWDKSRIGQAVSNSMANALQHSDATSPVTVFVNGDGANELSVAVHNHGRAIE